jgi:hypothetical protein
MSVMRAMSVSLAEVVIAMAWYSPATWAQLKAISEARIEISYDEFVRNFERLSQQFVARGVKVEKVVVDVDQMVAWCHRNGYAVDTTGRSIYSSVLVMAHEAPDVLNQPIVDNITRSVQ